MEPLSYAAAAVGMLLAVLNIREKLWPTPPKPHPLQPVLIDIARAIRERPPHA
jgi:hypothetical protein